MERGLVEDMIANHCAMLTHDFNIDVAEIHQQALIGLEQGRDPVCVWTGFAESVEKLKIKGKKR